MNNFKVGILLAAITALFLTIGHLLGGQAGMVIALVLAVVMNMGTFWFSDKLVIKMTGAQPLTRDQIPELFDMTERLARRAEIPMPKLYLVPDPSPNAFATGRNPQNGVVAVNQGLLNLLDVREVEGVVAHELAHIKHRDTLTSAIVATLAGAISSIANIAMFASLFGGGSDEDRPNPLVQLLLIFVAPMAAMMIQFAVSRAREYEADRTAAELVGDSRGLASALARLQSGAQQVPGHMPPSAAHMCIVNPLAGVGGLANLFSTHPPMDERIRRLNEWRPTQN
ncbi:MAG: zinc metalloprotease HtpX [Chthonomonas sp.]|nr:zinc metalloprotease HtpX [Chthonomonas sp.]